MRVLSIITIFALVSIFVDDRLGLVKGIKAFEAGEYPTALKELEPLATSGNHEAQFYVAKMHYFGFGVPKNMQKAFEGYTNSAEQGSARAQNNLGLMYLNGEGVEKNVDIAYLWISKAADQNLSVAQTNMGIALIFPGSPIQLDVTRGLNYLEAAAAKDHTAALTILGDYYRFVDIDYDLAITYFQRAVDLGDAHAMHTMYFEYMKGTAVAMDKPKAMSLLQKSVELGHVAAYYDLAVAYLNGNGIEKNTEEGIELLKKSVAQANDIRSMETLANIYVDLREHFQSQNYALESIQTGIELRKRAATAGNSIAQYNLYIQFYYGSHVPLNKTEAIEWLETSAKGGYAIAQYELGRIYARGRDVTKNQKKAILLYKSAAESGYDEAKLAYASANMMGIGTDKNYVVALDWLKQLPEKESAGHIGWIYAQGGNGIKQNRDKAEIWLKKSDKPAVKAFLPMLYLDEDYGTIDFDKAATLVHLIEQDLDIPSLTVVSAAFGAALLQAKKPQEAKYWLKKAADGSGEFVSRAQFLLGVILADEDLEQARQWFKKLVEQKDHMVSQASAIFLALSYMEDQFSGLASESDLKKARNWFEVASTLPASEMYDFPILEYLDDELSQAEQIEAERLAKEKQIALKKAQDEKQRLAQIEAQKRLAFEKEERRKKKAEKTDWVSLLVGAAIVGYAYNKYEKKKKKKKKSSKSYDFSNTKGMSSIELGEELLRQKHEKGISGRGYVAPYQQPSIGYNPNNSSAVTNIQTQNSARCNYTINGQNVYISKQHSWQQCPSSINIPNSPGTHFDLSQMGKSSGTTRILNHGKSASSPNYCFYSDNIQIPKAPYGSCPDTISY